jgi:hypothetical protein
VKLLAMAMYDLHMTEEAFWNCTPALFDEIIERWILQEEREDRRHAMVASVIANANRSAKTKAYKISDFVVHDLRGSNLPKGKTWEEQLAFVKALHGKFTKGKPVSK